MEEKVLALLNGTLRAWGREDLISDDGPGFEGLLLDKKKSLPVHIFTTDQSRDRGRSYLVQLSCYLGETRPMGLRTTELAMGIQLRPTPPGFVPGTPGFGYNGGDMEFTGLLLTSAQSSQQVFTEALTHYFDLVAEVRALEDAIREDVNRRPGAH